MGMKKKEINYQLLIRRICLIVLDIICIIAASILALLTRFEFDFSQIPKEFLKVIYKYGPFTIVITLIIFSLFRIYSSLWEYAGIEEVFSLIAACLAAAVAKIVIILFTWSVMPRSWYVLDTIYLMILIGATRVSYRLIRLRRQNRTFPWSKRKKVMIIGGGEAGRSLITEIQNSKYLDQKVVCIIDDDPYKIGRYIKGVKVVGNRNSIKKSVKKYNVQQIILTIPSANAAKIRPIVEICQDTNCELMILPGVYQLVNGEVKASKLRPVNIDDLLGRDEVHVNLNEVMDYVSGRVIMVTGGGGSIPGEGKTTLSANLAISIAQQGKKVLLVDCDLRNPSIAGVMNEQEPHPGLGSVLKKEVPLSEAITNVKLPKERTNENGSLHVIFGGAPDGENSLLIGSGRMRALIKDLKSKYDIIILDTAPSELLADAPLLGKYVDAALYVIRYDYTKLREIREGVESLALSGIDMLGYVFNGDNSSGGQGYGYGYRRYGNYGSYGSHYGSYGKYGAYGHYGKMEKGSTDKFGRVIKD